MSLFFCNAYREHDARRCPGCKRKREGAEEREREHGERRAMMVSRRRCRRRRRRRNRQAAKCSLALPLLSALAARGASALQAPRGDHGSRACDSKKRTRARVCAREREREGEPLSSACSLVEIGERRRRKKKCSLGGLFADSFFFLLALSDIVLFFCFRKGASFLLPWRTLCSTADRGRSSRS